LKRLQQVGDLFAPVLSLKQSLPDVITNSVQFPTRASAAESKSLRAYAKKRDFSSTSEPRPNIPAASGQGARRRFVVQKHAATHLHYDFRLEMHQVLKSWAVPKGIPYDLGEKRLAMATEDHPIGYLDFEGTIPKGQYGGGTVMVWDIGTYELMEGNYYKGNLQLYLEGKKLQGEWLLTKDRSTKNKNWWLRKSGSPMKPPDAAEENRSALTGRALEQIAAENDAQWQSNRTPIPDLDLDSLPPNVITQAAEIDRTIRQEVMFAKLCTGFAVLALLIACVGLYGTMSYSVARQLGEIGIRMALGAQRGALIWMVLRRVLLLAAVGLAISVPAALSASRLVKSFLFETQPNDPGTLALAGVVLLSAAILAGYAPARRASRIDPVAALRQE
jgi:DNA ligase D-like protein (predicted 3'-phosphoesterase)